MEPAISPRECALAIALPLTQERFLCDATAPDKDFARSVMASSGRSAEDAWTHLYAPKVVSLYDRIAARARAVGATVASDVTAPVLRRLLEEFPLVSLFAHSKSSAVQSADILEPYEVLRIIAGGGTIVARHLRNALAHQQWTGDQAALRGQIAAALDEALAPTRAWTETPVRRDRAGRPDRLLSRTMLEDCFGTALRRAPLLELSDGLKTAEELFAAIPPEFAGVLDLSVCNSFALGESIKRRRQHCLVIENVFLARIDLRLVRYALVLDRLARRPARYTDALVEVNQALIGDGS
jgi:hypothetical protein